MTPAGASHTDDERATVVRAIEGDAEAFGVLYTRHLDAIYRYIYFRVGDEDEAEDLTDEVFVRAWEALPAYRIQEYPFRSWLYRIAHNLVVDRLRRHRPAHLPEESLRNLPAQVTPPEEAVSLQQDRLLVLAAVQQLDDEEQQVVILRFIEGLPHREVARVIGKSEGASRVIQHRALTKLEALLSNREVPSDGTSDVAG